MILLRPDMTVSHNILHGHLVGSVGNILGIHPGHFIRPEQFSQRLGSCFFMTEMSVMRSVHLPHTDEAVSAIVDHLLQPDHLEWLPGVGVITLILLRLPPVLWIHLSVNRLLWVNLCHLGGDLEPDSGVCDHQELANLVPDAANLDTLASLANFNILLVQFLLPLVTLMTLSSRSQSHFFL